MTLPFKRFHHLPNVHSAKVEQKLTIVQSENHVVWMPFNGFINQQENTRSVTYRMDQVNKLSKRYVHWYYLVTLSVVTMGYHGVTIVAW